MLLEHPPAPMTFSSVKVGDELPVLVKQPTRTMLFRFSAVTWNTHRIHYDSSYAAFEGHPDVLVQATMHGGFLLQMLQRVVGAQGRIVSFGYSNRARAVPDKPLTYGGRVTASYPDSYEVDCDIWGQLEDGTICSPGHAKLRLVPA